MVAAKLVDGIREKASQALSRAFSRAPYSSPAADVHDWPRCSATAEMFMTGPKLKSRKKNASKEENIFIFSQKKVLQPAKDLVKETPAKIKELRIKRGKFLIKPILGQCP
jgi:hypothetical protein